jgi:DNA helicase-2/ATP-dependent DNA helicase PcrA
MPGALDTLDTEARERLDRELRIAEAVLPALPRGMPGYLAHLSLTQDKKPLDVVLATGVETTRFLPSKEEIRVVDIATSPFAEVLFSVHEGERYEVAGRGGVARGQVREVTLTEFSGGALVRIVTAESAITRGEDGAWTAHPLPAILLSPRPKNLRAEHHSVIDVTLDRAQESTVTLPRGRSALVLGEAGHGKTTVALHRLAHLVKSGPRSFRAVVIVPTEGLRRLLESLTVKLGVDVPVMLYEKWAEKQARRAFPDLPRRVSKSATPAVIRLKRDPALRIALAALSARPPGLIDDDEDRPQKETPALAHHGDLQHLFGDRKLMEAVSAEAKQPHSKVALEELLEHTRVQFESTTEKANAHVDRARLVTVDHLSLDEGTPMEDAQTVDAEDYAVMFELDRLRAERASAEATAPKPYDCIVLDEAQELAPLELALIGRSLARKGTLVVAGDADQQIDPAVTFSSWTDTMTDLACTDYEKRVLAIGYRCPRDVVALARHALDPARPLPKSAKVSSWGTETQVGVFLSRALTNLGKRDPSAEVVVICRSPLAARHFATMLRHAVPCHLVLDGEFLPGRGCSVTWVGEVKGLEFDHVIVPDASAASYPDSPVSRRALYVAITRARHQVVLACAGAPSPILI